MGYVLGKHPMGIKEGAVERNGMAHHFGKTIGLLIKEDVQVCQSCQAKVG